MSDQKVKPKNSGYALKAKYEGIPTSFGSRKLAYNHNLTDEMAKELVENHPAGEKLFDVIPEKTEGEESDEEFESSHRVKELLDSKNRDELNEIAKELELDPEEYRTKELVATAIATAELENLND